MKMMMAARKVNFYCCLVVVTVMTLTQIASTMALANCPPGCQCDDNLLVVQCGEGQLDVLPIALNPSIQRLVIRRNKIKTIDSSIQFYAELTFLDLSANHLMTIPQRTFAYQKKLHELHLNDNKIGQLSNRTFIGLNTLTVLNLRGNLVSELHAGVFASLPRIEELNLGENRIGYIDVRAFEGLTQLRILYLDDNALTSVPDPVILQALPRLAELMLGGNALETISAGAFSNVGAGLTRLDLRGSALRNISHDAFTALAGSLRVLDLSGNRFSKIPTVALSMLQRLEELTLGENDFESISEGAFVGLKQLKQLDISGALRLKRVMNGAFATNTNLVHLQLSSNKMLMEVQEGALSGLPHLRHVILKANALTTLAEGLFPWRDLITLDLSENPLVCDCRIMWLRNLLLVRNASKAEMLSSDEILCAYPERLRSEALRNLNPQLIGCLYGSEARRQALVGALLVGSAATITALALIIYRCRRKIREFLKKGGGFGGRSKEREYQKTFCDEDYMTRHHIPNMPTSANGNMATHMLHHHHHHHQQQHGSAMGQHHNYLQHATPCNMYTPAHQPYSMCTLESTAAYNNKICQQQNNGSKTLESKILKTLPKSAVGGNCAPACMDDSASFMMLMKANCHSNINQQQQQQQQLQQQQQQQLHLQGGKLNHYTKTLSAQTPGSFTSSNESSYSYVDVPLVHSVTAADHAHYRQQQQQHYRSDLNEAFIGTDDPNYIYSNTHYSLPLERSGSNSVARGQSLTNGSNIVATATKPIVPPALPLRNGMQSRRSFNLNNINNNKNTNSNNNNNSSNNNNNNNNNTLNTNSSCNTDTNINNNNNVNNNSNSKSNNNNATSNSTTASNNNNLIGTLRNFH